AAERRTEQVAKTTAGCATTAALAAEQSAEQVADTAGADCVVQSRPALAGHALLKNLAENVSEAHR
ncbi:MAG: hypothetical protein KA800_07735, partial [Thauera sp.]|nr:hypothetical protein [Thauera sp.]